MRKAVLVFMLSFLVLQNSFAAARPAWSSLTFGQKCKETLQIVTVLGVLSGIVVGLVEGPHLYHQHQRRQQLMTELQSPFQTFVKEYQKLVAQDPRYSSLVAILFEEAKNSQSALDFFERAKYRRVEIEAMGWKLEDVKKLPPSFQEAFFELAFKAYRSGMTYEDFRWMLNKVPELK